MSSESNIEAYKKSLATLTAQQVTVYQHFDRFLTENIGQNSKQNVSELFKVIKEVDSIKAKLELIDKLEEDLISLNERVSKL